MTPSDRPLFGGDDDDDDDDDDREVARDKEVGGDENDDGERVPRLKWLLGVPF